MRILLRRLLGTWLVTAISICSVSGVSLMADGNGGQNNQVKIKAEKITEKFPNGNLECRHHTDESGNILAYRWKTVSVNGKKEWACFSISVSQGKLVEQKIRFNKKTKQFVKKHRSELELGTEWQDKRGNFFFATGNKGKDKKYIMTLHQVNKKGQITKNTNLNKWLKIAQESNAAYSLYLDYVKDDTVVFRYSDYKKRGYVFAARDTGRIRKQVVYSRGDFIAGDITPSKLVGVNGERNQLVTASLTKEKKIKLSSGNTIQYAEVKEYTEGKTIPQEKGQYCYSFGRYKNKVYLLTSAGYYKVNMKKATCEKIASTEEMGFIHRETEIIEENQGEYYKDFVTVEIIPVTERKFYVLEGSSSDETDSNHAVLWLCTLG